MVRSQMKTVSCEKERMVEETSVKIALTVIAGKIPFPLLFVPCAKKTLALLFVVPKRFLATLIRLSHVKIPPSNLSLKIPSA